MNALRYDEEIEQLATEYFNEGRETFFANNLRQAVLLVQNALHLYKEAGNYEQYTVALNLMGVIYGAMGNEAIAIDYFLEGLEYAAEYCLLNYKCLFYTNIGSRYQELHEHEKAIGYFLKSAEILETPECRKEERHNSWSLLTYLNLMSSYTELEQYELSGEFLKKAEVYLKDEAEATYKYTFLIQKCRLYWFLNQKAYVYEQLDVLMESGMKDVNTSDYVQDMKMLCELLEQMCEYDKWEQIIRSFEGQARKQDSVYVQLAQTEMWMRYYKATGNIKEYVHLCVVHQKLYEKQKEITDRERALAIDLKIKLKEKENERKRAELKSSMDALTGLGNRYLLEKDAYELIERAVKKKQRITIGVIDIDSFKQHNDTYGHIQGDKCLKEVADVLKKVVEGTGKAYRFGGDEFVLLFESGEKDKIELFAKCIQEEIHKKKIANINSGLLPELTVSQGYSCFIPKEGEDRERLMEHADRALYEVKNHGKNSFLIRIE